MTQTTDLKDLLGERVTLVMDDSDQYIIATENHFVVITTEGDYYGGKNLCMDPSPMDCMQNREVAVKLGLITRQEIEDRVQLEIVRAKQVADARERREYERLKAKFQ